MEAVSDHPKVVLLFYLYKSGVTDTESEMVRSVVDELNAGQTWVLGPLKFIDNVENPQNAATDLPFRRVGGEIQLYSAMPPWNLLLAREIDVAHYREVHLIVDRLAQFSLEHGLSIGLTLDGEDVGWIEDGSSDQLLRDGLLEPWRNALGL